MTIYVFQIIFKRLFLGCFCSTELQEIWCVTSHATLHINCIQTCCVLIFMSMLGLKLTIHSWSIKLLFLINPLVCKSLSQCPRAKGDMFKYRVLSERQSKAQRLSIYNHIKQIKAANPHLEKLETENVQVIFNVKQFVQVNQDDISCNKLLVHMGQRSPQFGKQTVWITWPQYSMYRRIGQDSSPPWLQLLNQNLILKVSPVLTNIVETK